MPRILYIEDNADNRMLVRRILMASDYDFTVEEAANATEGIEKAKTQPPDLILMDVSMPDMDGLTATQILRALPALQNTAIVAMTANVMDGDKERSLDAGCDGYIGKPIDVDKLPDDILFYLRRRNERGAKHHESTRAD
ncbi:MAG TPA: response regulator [Oceanobacillus sp.]|nr:response regulator [Oceanobacillus sp.]